MLCAWKEKEKKMMKKERRKILHRCINDAWMLLKLCTLLVHTEVYNDEAASWCVGTYTFFAMFVRLA